MELHAAPSSVAPRGRAGGRLRALRSRLRPNALVKVLSGSALTWSFLPDDGSPAHSIHRWFRSEVWDETGAAVRAALLAGALLGVPVAAAGALGLAARLGPNVAELHGKSLLRQLAEQLGLALRVSMPPLWYYIFELWDDERRSRATEYLHRFETKTGAYPYLRRWLVSELTSETLSDKLLFALRCRSHGVPAIEVLATARQGCVSRLDGLPGLPRTDLFLKPIRGAGGAGAGLWRCLEDGRYESHDGELLDEEGLLRHLGELSREKNYLVRPRAVNHPEIRELSPGALCTVRIVSCLNEKGGIELTHAVLRMPRSPRAIVDNFHAGGIAAMVDLRSGVLGPATDMGVSRDSQWWERHPHTGAQIAGRRLPLWPELLDVTRRAHAAFPDQVAVGWDVAILESGPQLVEGNKSPDLDIIQRTHRTPVGNSKLGESLAFHLARARERQQAAERRGS